MTQQPHMDINYLYYQGICMTNEIDEELWNIIDNHIGKKLSRPIKSEAAPCLEQVSRYSERKFNIARRVKVTLALSVLTLSTLLGVDTIRDWHQAVDDQQEQQAQDQADLINIEALEQRGGCAYELYAQANFYMRVAKLDSTTPAAAKAYTDSVERYATAASLAKTHDISCTPENPGATSLTPNFDTTKLQASQTCADELQAKMEDPTAAENQFYADFTRKENIQRELQAGLAETFDIECQ